MNVFDIILLSFLAIGAAVGLYRGFFKEFVGTVGLLIAVIVANVASPYAKPWASEMISDELVASVVVWIVIFLTLMLIMSGIAWLLGKVFSTLNIGWVNRLAGGVFGMIKYVLIAALIVSALEFAAAHLESGSFLDSMQESRIVPVLHQIVHVIMPWVSDHLLNPTLEMFKG